MKIYLRLFAIGLAVPTASFAQNNNTLATNSLATPHYLVDGNGNQAGTSGNPLYVSGGGGGGGGAATIANGADVVEGTNTDAAGASSVFGMAKGIYGYEANRATTSQLINGTVTVGSITNPVSVTNTGTFAVQNTAAIPTGSNNIGSVTGYVGYNETAGNVALASGGSVGATNRTAPTWASYFGARVYASQAGTLYLGEQVAGGPGIAVATQAVAANTVVDLSVRVRGAIYYTTFVNSNSTAGTVALESSFTAN